MLICRNAVHRSCTLLHVLLPYSCSWVSCYCTVATCIYHCKKWMVILTFFGYISFMLYSCIHHWVWGSSTAAGCSTFQTVNNLMVNFWNISAWMQRSVSLKGQRGMKLSNHAYMVDTTVHYSFFTVVYFVSLCTYSVSVAAILSLPPSFHLQFQDPILLLLYQSACELSELGISSFWITPVF